MEIKLYDTESIKLCNNSFQILRPNSQNYKIDFKYHFIFSNNSDYLGFRFLKDIISFDLKDIETSHCYLLKNVDKATFLEIYTKSYGYKLSTKMSLLTFSDFIPQDEIINKIKHYAY